MVSLDQHIFPLCLSKAIYKGSSIYDKEKKMCKTWKRTKFKYLQAFFFFNKLLKNICSMVSRSMVNNRRTSGRNIAKMEKFSVKKFVDLRVSRVLTPVFPQISMGFCDKLLFGINFPNLKLKQIREDFWGIQFWHYCTSSCRIRVCKQKIWWNKYFIIRPRKDK